MSFVLKISLFRFPGTEILITAVYLLIIGKTSSPDVRRSRRSVSGNDHVSTISNESSSKQETIKGPCGDPCTECDFDYISALDSNQAPVELLPKAPISTHKTVDLGSHNQVYLQAITLLCTSY